VRTGSDNGSERTGWRSAGDPVATTGAPGVSVSCSETSSAAEAGTALRGWLAGGQRGAFPAGGAPARGTVGGSEGSGGADASPLPCPADEPVPDFTGGGDVRNLT